MKIALLSPKGPLYRHRGGIFKKSLRYQPLTLTTLAALVPAELEAEIELYDEGIQEVPDVLDADLIGMTVITGTARRAYELADRFRAQERTVVLGGPHVTLLPEEAAGHADAVVVGYAEDTWPELLRDFRRGKLRREYRQAPDFSLERADMPFARRELFDRGRFLTQAVFEATRACAHDCEFCVAPSAWGRKQFQKPVGWVVEDIRRVGDRRILFVDLNLISDKAYARELFSALIPLGVRWFGLSTVLIAHDPELMQLMARSGCRGLLLGLETITPSGLQETGKTFNGSVDYARLIADLHELGIAIQGCFVFGLDHDTPDVFDATVEFAIDTGIDLPRFAVLTPFPGTPLHRRLEQQDRILTRDWELYDGQHVVFRPLHMSPQQLAAGHERAWKNVYRYGAIARRLWKARAFEPLALAANLGYRFYAHHLHSFYTCDWHLSLAPPVSAKGPLETRGKPVCG
ncbi:MAG: B12-binding domain-containing radical SAM protein [Planctomycetes bacterium]|nr:B12-binding domain-containing radical SAM protein [Planctomycetota bacterium]